VLAAFDLQTGKILWQRWIDSDVQSAPVVAEGKVHVSTFGGAVYQLDPKTGEFLSARQSRATSAPTIAGGDCLRAGGAGLDGSASVPPGNQAFYAIDDLGRHEGLGHEVVGAGADCLLGFLEAQRRNHDHRNARSPGRCLISWMIRNPLTCDRFRSSSTASADTVQHIQRLQAIVDRHRVIA
jgi:hypothetical protein